jgi:preprotein translocase subunit YajC
MDSVSTQLLAWAAQETTSTAPSFPLPLLITVIVVLYIFLIYLPGRREKARAAQMGDTMVKGAAVITAGGIHGKIESVDKEGGTVNVTVAPKITLKFNRTSITTVTPREGKADKTEETAAP